MDEQTSTTIHRKVVSVLIFSFIMFMVLNNSSLFSITTKATNYSFGVNKEYVDVYINKDGSVTIKYEITFTNYGQLDGVDIGLPNTYYDAGSASAKVVVNGITYSPSSIYKSPYVDIGLAVDFTTATQAAIDQSGTVFTLYFSVNNPHMVYINQIKSGTVGIQFTPTWFDTSYQVGLTGELRARVFFPPGFTNSSQAVYLQNHPWKNLTMDSGSGLLMATWDASSVSPTDQSNGKYDVGVGFPTIYVNKYYNPNDFWENLGNAMSSLFSLLVTLCPCLVMAAIITFIFAINYYQGRKSKKDYLEPKLGVAGAGPRRDLTAPEAAIILEKPLEIVATMILFGLVNKKMVEIVSDEKPMRLKKLVEKGNYQYETQYLQSILPSGILDRNSLQETLLQMIKAVQAKLEGFDWVETRKYYKTICEKAWAQVQAAGTPEEFATGLSKNNEWMMLDDKYEHRMNRLPMILIFPVPVGGPYRQGGGGSAGAGVDIKGMANKYVSQVRNTSNNLVTNVKSMSNSIVNTIRPPPATSGISSLSGWGAVGGGGHCACACACACAGGGR